MTDETKATTDETPQATNETKPPLNATEAFARVSNKYRQFLSEIWLVTEAECHGHYRNYLQEVQEVHLQVQKDAQNAYSAYLKSTQGPSEKSTDAFPPQTAAPGCYGYPWTPSSSSGARQLSQVHEKHQKKFAASKEGFDKKNMAAFRVLLKDVQATWAELNTDKLDANDMRQLAQVLAPFLQGK